VINREAAFCVGAFQAFFIQAFNKKVVLPEAFVVGRDLERFDKRLGVLQSVRPS
jgi:hypothetical protein